MKKAIWLSLLLCVTSLLSTGAQISLAEKQNLLRILGESESSRLAIERHLSSISAELKRARERNRLLSSELGSQRRAWRKQIESSESRIRSLEEQKVRLQELLGPPASSEEASLSFEQRLKRYLSDLKAEIRRQKRQKLLLAGGEGLVILLLLIALL